MADVQLNVSNSTTVKLFPSDLFTLFVDLTVPANSSVFSLVDVKLPVDLYSASMTVVNASVVSISVN